MREDPINGPCVAGLTEIEAKNGDEIMTLLHRGNERRTQQPTAANEVSSRSHAVLTVVVEGKERAPGTVATIKVGKLSLVDLAGSERAANTQNRGVRLIEGANINRSLLALGNCINALGEKNKGNFVPYRDSKLTRLLKDSLGGNCRTVMIANISSAESSFEETLNTLKYANRAKNIKTNIVRNELNVNHHISEYVSLIANLRNEIKLLKDQIKQEDVKQGPPTRSSAEGISMPAIENLHIGGIPPKGRPFSPPAQPSQVSFQVVPPSPAMALRHSSTPLEALRESMRSAHAGGEGRELVNEMREKIVNNFQERMQLRRSLIELEDINVQNSIEITKRQLMIVHWAQEQDPSVIQGNAETGIDMEELHALIARSASDEVLGAWKEWEQLKKAVTKNQVMKKNIGKRLKLNEKEAEKFRSELSDKITGDDRRELMELQYQVGKLELENMELEQHKMVHDSILKGKDLTIHKLKLQLAMKDKLINRQRAVLAEHGLDVEVGYSQMLLIEDQFLGDGLRFDNGGFGMQTMSGPPPSPPRQLGGNKQLGTYLLSVGGGSRDMVDSVDYSSAVEAASKAAKPVAAAPKSSKGSREKASSSSSRAAESREAKSRGMLAQIYPIDDGSAEKQSAPRSSSSSSGNGRRLAPVVPKLVTADVPSAIDSDAEYAAQISDVRDRSHLNLLSKEALDAPATVDVVESSDWVEVDASEVDEEIVDDDVSVESEHAIEMRNRDQASLAIAANGGVAKGGRVYRKAVDINKGPRKHHPPVQKRVKMGGGLSALAVVGGKMGNVAVPAGIKGVAPVGEREDRWLAGGAPPNKNGAVASPRGYPKSGSAVSIGLAPQEVPAPVVKPQKGRPMKHSPISLYPGGDEGGLNAENGRGYRRPEPLPDIGGDYSGGHAVDEVGDSLEQDEGVVGSGYNRGGGARNAAAKQRMKNQALGKLKLKQFDQANDGESSAASIPTGAPTVEQSLIQVNAGAAPIVRAGPTGGLGGVGRPKPRQAPK